MIVDTGSLLRDKKLPTTRDQSILENSTLIQIPLNVSPTQNAVLSVKKSDDPILAAKRFCFENNLDFKLIQPISKRIDFLLENDGFDDCSMRHIAVQEDYEEREKSQYKSKRNKSRVREQQSSHLNSGVMMYERNCRLSELTRRKIKVMQEEMQAEKDKQLTFKPEINQLSKIVVSQIQEAEGRGEFYERKKRQQMSRIFWLQKSKQKFQMRECTFKPNTNSRRISSERSLSKTYYLENLAKPKKLQSKEQQSSFSFHPKINQISEMIVNGVPFEERQEKYRCDKMMRRSASIRESTQSLRSSQCKRTNKLTSTRNLQNLPIGQYLYNQRFSKQIKIQKIREETQAKPATANVRSSKLYETNKYKSFIQIFKNLDSNKDSVISSSKISTKTLPPEVLELIAPLLAEMQQLSFELTQQQFVEALDKLYSTLNIKDRNTFIKFTRGSSSRPKDEACPFKPIIDENSSILATRVRQFSTPGVSLYNFCQQRKSLLNKKMQERRREKENIETAGCTFRPSINK